MYLTPLVQGVAITIYGEYYSWYQTYSITPQATYCTGGGASPLVCTLPIDGYAGPNFIDVVTYDAPYDSGYAISHGDTTVTLAAGAAGTFAVTTNGIVSRAGFALDTPYPATGTPQTIPLRVFAADADGYEITGPFDQPITINTSGNGVTVSNTSLASSSDLAGLTVTEPGTAQSTTITGSVGGGSVGNYYNANGGAPLVAAPSVTLSAGGNGPYASPSLLTFASPTAAAQSITISGAGTSTGPFTLTTGTPPNGDAACGSKVTISGASPVYTVAPNTGTSGFSCSLVITDAASATAALPILIQP
jgi:hypothetical protein